MKRIFLLFTVLLPLQILFAGNNVRVQESISFYSKILNQDVKYSVSLPMDYFRTKNSYPVVYLLHGLGDDESSWLEYGRITQAADRLIKNREIIPMIFIMAQGFRNYYVNDHAGTFLYQDMFTKELVPLIDSLFRTVPGKHQRALMGYSMGGFGALLIPLKHPDIFTVSVPLSISIRTDAQYIKEDAAEWDQQWGRLFGGVGKVGEDRITDYYKENYPFHIIETTDLQKYSDLKIYIDNGDDEQTLCRSNEELHILMRNKSFPHEFRVRNGGHEFVYWREAIPNGLRFISDAFDGKKYRGDVQVTHPPKKGKPANSIIKKSFCIILPDEYNYTNRNYPVVYFMGDFSMTENEKIGSLVGGSIETGSLPPLIVVFINENTDIRKVISETESDYRIRKGYRFRAIIAYGKSGNNALKLCLDSLQFTSCAIFDGNPDYKYAEKVLKDSDRKIRTRTWYYIDSPDKGKYFVENGFLHILFRESDLYHEYRVREGEGGFDWFLSGLYDALIFTQDKIHK